MGKVYVFFEWPSYIGKKKIIKLGVIVIKWLTIYRIWKEMFHIITNEYILLKVFNTLLSASPEETRTELYLSDI